MQEGDENNARGYVTHERICHNYMGLKSVMYMEEGGTCMYTFIFQTIRTQSCTCPIDKILHDCLNKQWKGSLIGIRIKSTV